MRTEPLQARARSSACHGCIGTNGHETDETGMSRKRWFCGRGTLAAAVAQEDGGRGMGEDFALTVVTPSDQRTFVLGASTRSHLAA